jgi:hypothetical protein
LAIDEVVFANRKLLRVLGEDNERYKDDTKLMVSLHSIEFSHRKEGYLEVANDVFFSNLIYLLYIKKIVAGADLETAKEKNKSVLIKELERKKSLVLKRSSVRSTDALDCGKTDRKLVLLNKAIFILKRDEKETAFGGFDFSRIV